MGAAVGTIMPTIMIVHMRRTRPKSTGSHGRTCIISMGADVVADMRSR